MPLGEMPLQRPVPSPALGADELGCAHELPAAQRAIPSLEGSNRRQSLLEIRLGPMAAPRRVLVAAWGRRLQRVQNQRLQTPIGRSGIAMEQGSIAHGPIPIRSRPALPSPD